jgi:hypothetical protein
MDGRQGVVLSMEFGQGIIPYRKKLKNKSVLL